MVVRKDVMKGKTYTELFKDQNGPVLITTPQNIFYTIGFYTTARRPAQIGYNCVLMTPEDTWFFYPAGWQPLVLEQIDTHTIHSFPYQGKLEQLAEQIVGQLEGERQLGFERDGMELNLYLALQERLKRTRGPVVWFDVSSCLQKARLIKTPGEIEALRKSALVARAAMEYAKTVICPGMRELDVVAELEFFMRKNGSEGVPFTMKALSGENAIRTVNIPGNDRIREGDIVLLDFGATVENYASDWSRSFSVGKVDERQQELYRLVWQIERSCIEMIRPGVALQELLDQAMSVIQGHPYARWFNPYLGHSIGINSQEWPAIVPGAEEVIKENMVITIEPGIYVPGLGGVRIEDEIWVTASGHEILTGLQNEEFLISGGKNGE